MIKDVLFDETLLDRFVKEVKEKYPKKAFGFFISDTEGGQPVDFIMFNDDVRNEWKDEFEKYGQYYVSHEDAGFWQRKKKHTKSQKRFRP